MPPAEKYNFFYTGGILFMEFDLSKPQCFYFKQIADIPRGSRNEKAVSDYIVEFAIQHGLEWKQDEVFNVMVFKPASTGYEEAPAVMLQAHLDVVCEKNKDVVHDFTKDPVDLYVDEEGFLRARGTTLGCDDGYGCAYMLAILADDTLPHPALQCIFTTMEEIGLIGASHLKKEDLRGKRLINLDGGGETSTTVSSSGGARTVIRRNIEWEENDLPAYHLEIRGLSGGHSGGCIHMERGNAVLLAARILMETKMEGLDIRLCDIEGGMKFNAIPREADISFVSSSSDEDLMEAITERVSCIAKELEGSDDGFSARFSRIEKKQNRMTKECSDSILSYLFLMPNGFQHRSMQIEGLTVSSLNAGTVSVNDGCFVIEDLIRSAIPSHTDVLIEQLKLLASFCGMTVEVHDRYMGWAYKADSEMRAILKDVLKDNGMELKEEATHGGLECGIFAGLDPQLDIITFGPVSSGAHTPEEKMDLSSFDRVYEMLKELLKRCR